MKNTLANYTRKLLCLLAIANFSANVPVRAADGPTNHATALVPARSPDAAKKAGEWKDPDKVLADVNYDGLPITEVGRDLKQKFDGQFDMLYPYAANGGTGRERWEWQNTGIFLQLKNVKASEVFNAMNLVFENAKTPLRWELLMNGNRQTVLLRDLYERVPEAIDPATGLLVSPSAVAEKPMVFFVGDLVVDHPVPGGLVMEQLAETVITVCRAAKQEPNISIHKQAQLLIVRGTEKDIVFVQSVLVALRDKARLDANRQAGTAAAEPRPKRNNGTNAP